MVCIRYLDDSHFFYQPKNKKNMIQLCELEQIPLICITETMDCEEIDLVIMAALRRLKPSDKVINLSRPIRKVK